jgi:ABC-type branched-subunit amino acid transport system ATPase component
MPALVIKNMRASYGAAVVLHGVDLEVPEGGRVGLLGINGAGKTTTLRAISGMVGRRADELTFGGTPLPPDPVGVARLGIAHVPEGRGLFAQLTVRDNLVVGAQGMGRRLTAPLLERVVEAFPQLRELLPRRAGLLSGGQQQIVALARGLVAEPRLLMVDELSLGLSPVALDTALRALTAAADRFSTSLLLVDQNAHSLAATCDRLYLLRDGVAAPADKSQFLSAGGLLE